MKKNLGNKKGQTLKAHLFKFIYAFDAKPSFNDARRNLSNMIFTPQEVASQFTFSIAAHYAELYHQEHHNENLNTPKVSNGLR